MVVNPDRVLKTIAAIEAGESKTVRMMLKAGVPANHFVTGTSATDQSSLAHYAASSGQFEIFETLIAAGANIDAIQEYSWRAPMSMLECACSARLPSLEIIQKILSEGRPSKDHLNQSLLAACYGDVAIVDALLVAGADPNCIDSNFDTPIIVAILSDKEEVAIRLFEAGADGNGAIRNKDRAPFWKKSIQDAARAKAMNRLVSLLSSSKEQPETSDKPKRAHKPKTVADCWKHIDNWLAKNATNVRLPSPFDFSQKLADYPLLQTPASEQIKLSLIGRFTHLQQPIGECATKLAMATAYAAKAAELIDQGDYKTASTLVNGVKAEGVEIALAAADAAMRAHGALGYSREVDLGDRVRDLMGLRIADGTTGD
jgi:ankyrin repeat protein